VPPRLGEGRVGPLEPLDDRDAVEDRELRDRIRMVEGEPVGDARAAVVPGHSEPLVPEVPHQPHDVPGHHALRVGGVILGRRRLRRVAVPAQVGADDRERVGEERRDTVPRGVRPRMPVEEDERRPRAPVPHAEHRLADVDPLELEPLEHGATA
jgi:hypothetical protein